jgi:hypothetical protein
MRRARSRALQSEAERKKEYGSPVRARCKRQIEGRPGWVLQVRVTGRSARCQHQVTRGVSKGCVPIEVSFALQIDSEAEVGIRVAEVLKVLAMRNESELCVAYHAFGCNCKGLG